MAQRLSSPSAVSVDALVAQAHAAHATGRVADARTSLERALAGCPSDGLQAREIWSDLAVVAAEQGAYDEALSICQQLLRDDPGHHSALEVRAHCTAMQAQVTSAQRLSLDLQRTRVSEFRRLWTCTRVVGEPICHQALQCLGAGTIVMDPSVQFGWSTSPGFLSGYAYVEARNRDTRIEIGARVVFNNNPVLIGEGEGISIGPDSLFGPGVQILDTDAHDLHPARRHGGNIATAHVSLARNVFLGSSVIVTKGVEIGEDSVVGAGSVVTKSIPAGVIAAGNPARVVRELPAT